MTKKRFRWVKVHYIWHWITEIVETSCETVIKCDLLLNINLISNLGKFEEYGFEFGLKKLAESELQRRFLNIFELSLLFFQALFKRWVNNKLKLNESSLLYIFYDIL